MRYGDEFLQVFIHFSDNFIRLNSITEKTYTLKSGFKKLTRRFIQNSTSVDCGALTGVDVKVFGVSELELLKVGKL